MRRGGQFEECRLQEKLVMPGVWIVTFRAVHLREPLMRANFGHVRLFVTFEAGLQDRLHEESLVGGFVRRMAAQAFPVSGRIMLELCVLQEVVMAFEAN